MSVTIKKKTVSPAMAKMWLDKRAPNRNIVDRSVQLLLSYFASGTYKDTADPIKFNLKGELIDGQHRLSALTLHGRPVEMWVAEGLEMDVLPVLDTGRSRGPKETLDIWSRMHGKGWDKTAMRAAFVKMLLSYDHYKGEIIVGGNMGSNFPLTRFELVAATDKYKDAGPSLDVGMAASKTLRCGAAVFATLHYLFASVDEAAANRFMHGLVTGEELKASDQVQVLRTQLLALSLAKKEMSTMEVAYRVIRCWNAKMRGERLSKIQLPKDKKALRLPPIEGMADR